MSTVKAPKIINYWNAAYWGYTAAKNSREWPKAVKEKIGIGEVKVLRRPKADSHKGDNGVLFIIGGSSQYHGAPLLAAKIAGKIVDLVYFASTPQNNMLAQKLKARLLEFVAVDTKDISKFVNKSDAVLIGPGMGVSKTGTAFIKEFLKKYADKKIIIDADGLNMIKPRWLHANCIITPHRREFRRLFKLPATKDNAGKMAKRYGCVITLKGKTDYVACPGMIKTNTTGNAGMTKGGTGDVLAGLAAALACVNGNFLAASAAVFVNGLAGDRLAQKVSHYFSAAVLIGEIPRALQFCEAYERPAAKPAK